MRHRLILILPWLALACGDLGPTPSEKVLASSKKEEEKPYSDPYADGKRLADERKKLGPACDEAKKKAAEQEPQSAGLSFPAKLTKEDKAAMAAVVAALDTACAAAAGEDPTPILAAFGDVSKKALDLAGDYRGRSLKGIDLYKGTVDPAKEKDEKIFTGLADSYEAIGQAALDHLSAYLMYAPLPQRQLAADAMIALRGDLPPDFAETVKNKRLAGAMTEEGDEALRKKLRTEVYGALPE
jgi:hypothetical protein